jgi:hypothetical protein
VNDGTTIVAYRYLFQVTFGDTFNAMQAIEFLYQLSSYSWSCSSWSFFGITLLRFSITFSDVVIKIAITCTVSYLAYFTTGDGAKVFACQCS